MATRVGDFLIAHRARGRPYVEKLLENFEMGSLEQGSFRYCGKTFVQTLIITVSENTRKVKPLRSHEGETDPSILRLIVMGSSLRKAKPFIQG